MLTHTLPSPMYKSTSTPNRQYAGYFLWPGSSLHRTFPRTTPSTAVDRTVLRALAEGRIRWAFWPPGTDPQTVARAAYPEGEVREGAGIWIAHGPGHDRHDDIDAESEGDEAPAAEVQHSDDDDDNHSSDEEDSEDVDEGETGDEDEDASDEDDVKHASAAAKSGGGSTRPTIGATTGRFRALVLDDEGEDEDEDDDS